MPASERPEVHINCAVSADGRLAYAGGKRARLSGPQDLARVQWLRADVDGILVGIGTVLLDDPSLRVHGEMIDRPVVRSPTRIVLDSSGRTPPSARVLDGSVPTIVAVSESCTRSFPSNVTVLRSGGTRVDLAILLAQLHRTGMRKILVEGGGEVIAAFLRGGWFDRCTVYVAPVVIGGATAPPMVRGPETGGDDDATRLRFVSAEPIDDGVLLTYRPRESSPTPARPLSDGGPARPPGARP
jgi:2,5-diamino-6-(ribosylamino)-4(3H)-pyrimidinone 5'-phosphate reductase